MSQPSPLEILSDDEDQENQNHNQESPLFPIPSNLVIIDGTPTPRKPNPSLSALSYVPETPMSSNDLSIVKCTSKLPDPTPFLVPETPMSIDDFSIVKCPSKLPAPTPFLVPETPMSSDPIKSDFSIGKCTSILHEIRSLPASAFDDVQNGAGVSGSIYLESDIESVDCILRKCLSEYEPIAPDFDKSLTECERMAPEFGVDKLLNDVVKTAVCGGCSTSNTNNEVHDDNEEENVSTKKVGDAMKQIDQCVKLVEEQSNWGDNMKAKKRKAKGEKTRLAEEKKLKREKERLEKKALKAEAVEAKKLQKEQQKWEKGKFALKSIVAEIDAKVIELGAIGGHLLTRFAEKDISYRVTSNPIERSILWTMSVPEQLTELSSKGKEVRYVLLVYEAAEFCNLVINGSLMSHVSKVQSCYPSYTICYLTNRLMAYVNKREQAQFKNHPNGNFLILPPVQEVLSKLTTDFVRVHSRQCRDEAEIADHVVGLTCALANCQFRKNLTRLSINANGAVVPKDFIDRNLIKKNIWLKALVAIPMVQPRFAIAIGKKYPTMKSLLDVYMDQSKSVHEKEFLLENLPTEGLLGQEDRRVGPVCSKRVYRILMAQSGNIKTNDVELGADFFTNCVENIHQP